MNWYDKLKEATHCHEREEIANHPDCPIELLAIFIADDVEETVITAAMDNQNCTEELRSKGQLRLENIQKQKNESFNSSICPIPWTHIGIQQNGDYRICCQAIYKPFGKLEENGKILNVQTTDINIARNHTELKSLRLQMLKNQRPSMCKLCYNEEQLGLSSKRQFMLLKYDTYNYQELTKEDGTIDTTDFPLRYIDLRFGNLCNLKCRYCGPGDSSLWYDDFVQSNDTNVINYYGSKEYNLVKVNNKWEIDSLDFQWYEDEKFWNTMKRMIPYIDRYYFTGGEPTINKTHYDLLQLIIDSGYSNKVTLEYNSNMVAIPDKLYAQWDQFNKVDIGCSIDGYGEYANYLRYPSKWKDLEENMDVLGYRENNRISAGIATTINVYNILNYLDLVKWLISKNYTRIKHLPSHHVLEGPAQMSIQVLPLEIKHEIKKQYELYIQEINDTMGDKWAEYCKNNFNGILNYMFATDKSYLLPKLAKDTYKLDKLRDQKLEDVIPWLDDILKQYKVKTL